MSATKSPYPRPDAASVTTETIEWKKVADGELPDADLTVLIEIDPASDYSEPVFMGAWDGEVWRDVHGVEVPVIAFADPPKGTLA